MQATLLALILALARIAASASASATPNSDTSALAPSLPTGAEAMTKGIGDSTRRNWTDSAGKTWQVVDPNASRLPLHPRGIWFENIWLEGAAGEHCAWARRLVSSPS